MPMVILGHRMNGRQAVIQAAFLAIMIVMIWGAITSARTNLAELGISSGFAFLDRATGWSYSFSLVDKSIDDPYRQTLWIGFLNTLFLGVISIVLATVLGILIGTARDIRNLAARCAATLWVQIFRNIPLILQLTFWYAILIHMPGPKQSLSFLDLAFLSNRGLMILGLNIETNVVVALFIIAAVAAFALNRYVETDTRKKFEIWFLIVAVSSLMAVVLYTPEGEGVFSVPELKGLRFVGGIPVPIELVAMIVAIVFYGSAYIAEVVRGGLEEVPKGLVEAGHALGLTEREIWLRIKMPMALRTIIPPIVNQWIFLMKATTIGVAIGFSDLFMLVSTSITQSGQTLELIGILMAAFLLINYTIAQIGNAINARLKLKGH